MLEIVRAGYLTGVPAREIIRENEVAVDKVAGEPEKRNWIPWAICGVEAIIIIALLAGRKE